MKFENEYLINEKILKEVCKKLLRKSIIIGYVLGFINIIGYIVSILVLNNANYYVLAIGIGCLGIAFLSPLINSKRMLEYYKIENNGKLEMTKITFGKCITLDRGNTHLEMNYNQIYSKIETLNTIVLGFKVDQKSNAKINLIVLKNGFSSGKKDEFISFINQKINI